MPHNNPTLGDIIARRIGRRDLMQGLLATVAVMAVVPPALGASEEGSRFSFEEIAHGVDETHHAAKGHRADVLLRWGDPIVAGAPEFDPAKQSAAAQAKQFGYNNDYVGFAPIDATRGLLCVNHEYTVPEVMFPEVKERQRAKEINFASMTKELVDIEMAAHGCSVVEIQKGADGRWSWVRAAANTIAASPRSRPRCGSADRRPDIRACKPQATRPVPGSSARSTTAPAA